ncbi:MAG: hypothetical protein LQ337_004564 [Flavoplaca oasis]|nr:MAG: hypothetical protein LQ337_004564 [Flavoplaca oasis]
MTSSAIPPYVPIFESIRAHILQKYKLSDDLTLATKNVLTEARKRYPGVEKLTYDDYVEHWAKIADDTHNKSRQSPSTCGATDLWKRLFFCPLKSSNDAKGLANFLNTSYFPTIIHLGKLDGKIPLRLAPGNHHFEDGIELPDDHDFATVRAMAVKYDHRHAFTRTSHTSRDDGVLRRFKEVGSILMVRGASGWDETGHVLVLDMGVGRNRQPWIILASEWKVNVEYDYQIVEAHQNVRKNDSNAPGVFPGYSERTTIASLKALPPNSKDTPFLSRFGPTFNFTLDDHSKPSNMMSQGPELARVMPWVRKIGGNDWEEICYLDEDGTQEYMRYDARSNKFTYTELESLARKQIQDRDLRMAPPVPLSARSTNQPIASFGSSSQSPTKQGSPAAQNRPSSSGFLRPSTGQHHPPSSSFAQSSSSNRPSSSSGSPLSPKDRNTPPRPSFEQKSPKNSMQPSGYSR